MKLDRITTEAPWNTYKYTTTFKLGWEKCLAYAQVVYNDTNNAAVFICTEMQGKMIPVKIEKLSDFWKIPESSIIYVRGNNSTWDDSTIQFIFVNQLDVACVDVPIRYVELLIKDNNQPMTDEERRHVFDKYMDSIEINAAVLIGQKRHRDDMKAFASAMIDFADFSDDGSKKVYRSNLGIDFNISEICNKIVKNYKEKEK